MKNKKLTAACFVLTCFWFANAIDASKNFGTNKNIENAVLYVHNTIEGLKAANFPPDVVERCRVGLNKFVVQVIENENTITNLTNEKKDLEKIIFYKTNK